MKQKLFSQTIFIAKSLLWSLLLYVTTMMIIHWDDITRKNSGDKPLVNHKQAEQAAPVKVADEGAFLIVKPVKAITQKVVQALNVLY